MPKIQPATLLFVVLGVVSLIIQVVILRELSLLFYGNEIFLIIALSAWLFWTGLTSKIAEKIKLSQQSLIGLQIILFGGVFSEIYCLRFLKNWLGIFIGQLPNFGQSLLISLSTPLLPSIILGVWWSGRVNQHNQKKVNIFYFAETIGFFIAGILFAFSLSKLYSFQVLGLIFAFSVISLFSLNLQKKNIFGLGGVIIVVIISAIFANNFLKTTASIEKNSVKNLLANSSEIIIDKNTPYGNTIVANKNKEFFIFENTFLIDSTLKKASIKHLVDIALMFNPEAKQTFVIGKILGGAISELSLFKNQEIVWYLSNPATNQLVKETIKPDLKKENLTILTQDCQTYLRKEKKRFDIFLLNIFPGNSINQTKFFNEPFLRLVKQNLSKNGVFIASFPFSISNPGKNLEKMNFLFYQRLKTVFPKVLVFSESDNIFVAFKNPDPQVLKSQNILKNINLFQNQETRAYLKYRLFNNRNKEFIKSVKKPSILSSQFALLFYSTLFNLEKHSPNLTNTFEKASLWLIIIFTLGIIYLPIKRSKETLFSTFMAGFSIMILETIILFNWQQTIGSLYSKISVLIGTLTLGIALGVTTTKNISLEEKTLSETHKKFVILAVIALTVLEITPLLHQQLLTETMFWILAFLSGWLGGKLFAQSNIIFLDRHRDKKSTPYSIDLIGSALGTILGGLIILPLGGNILSLILLSIMHSSAWFSLGR